MRKKLLSILFAFVLILPMAFMVAACSEDHTHTHIKTNEYVVEDSKAYTTEICECGNVKKTELNNYIIATPSTAQDILDGRYGKISGKTIVFFKGTYSSLRIRSTIDTLSVIHEYNVNDPLDMETTTTLEALSNTTTYHYTRNLNNVNFVAVDGAKFEGLFSIQSKDYEKYIWQSDELTGLAEENTLAIDPIRNVKVADYNGDGNIDTGDVAFVDHINLDNITFENMNFSGSKGRVYIGNSYADQVEDITFKNCSFITEEEWSTYGAIVMDTQATTRQTSIIRKNIVVDGCTIDGHYQGVVLQNVENSTIKNSTIKNTIHNAINLQGHFSKGNILIDKNNMENTGDRAIRFSYLENATVLISNNTLTEAYDSDNEIIKTQTSKTGSSIEIKDTTIDGVALQNYTYETEEIPQIIISVPRAN